LGVDALKEGGLGKLQLKQRQKTENRLKKFLEKRQFVSISKIIKESKISSTAVYGALKRLGKEHKVLSYSHKNKKLFAWYSKHNFAILFILKSKDAEIKRSISLKESYLLKREGKTKKEIKILRQLVELANEKDIISKKQEHDKYYELLHEYDKFLDKN